MNHILILLFLFCLGSAIGWVIELFFRRFCSPNGRINKKWINPGFLVGPYLPLYGTGLCVLYLLAQIKIVGLEGHPYIEKLVLFAVMALAMTIVEYITGLIFIVKMHVKLWDYSDRWGNIQGIICPLFSFFWALLSAAYYLLIHPFILDALKWLSDNLAFSFFIGFFYGVFVIDLVVSFNILMKIKRFADENRIIIKYEFLRMRIRLEKEARKERASFFLSMHTGTSLKTFFEDMKETGEDYIDKFENILEEIGTRVKSK